MINEEFLKQFELNQKEAKVYLALLEMGPSSISEIARMAKITRTHGYVILEKLALMGLVARSIGRKKTYAAQHPNALLQLARNKRNSWEKRLEKIESSLPELVALFKTGDKPTIQYQEGADGLKNIYERTLDSKTEILSILDVDGWDTLEFSAWGKEYNAERSRKKIAERILVLDTEAARNWINDYRGSFKFTEYKFIRKEELAGIAELGGEINIYENKVMIALNRKPNQMGVLIESEALTKILRALFELAWKQVK